MTLLFIFLIAVVASVIVGQAVLLSKEFEEQRKAVKKLNEKK